jgi:hypothetical protein
LLGTDSKAAVSWHQNRWGRDVTASPQEGDLVVFSRRSPTESGGHVGFFIDQETDSIQILGGNQGNRISLGRYPKDGMQGQTRYQLLSIRRG